MRTTATKAKASVTREKLSTTVARENYCFVQGMVASGQYRTVAEVVDVAVERMRRAKNRHDLETATANYFDGLHGQARAEEDALATTLFGSANIDFDREL